MKFFRAKFAHPHIDAVEAGADTSKTQAAAFWSRKDISLKDIAMAVAYAVTVVWVSQIIAGLFSGLVPENPGIFMDFVGKFFGSQYVWITTISVIVATFFTKPVEKMNGAQEVGTYLIYLFLFVIGVPANIMTVITKSPLFLVLCFIMVVVNMIFCFVGAKLCKASLEDAIIASNANIGGPTTAAGMAISQGWTGLVGPAMLVGVLGYVIGNYMGTIVGFIVGASGKPTYQKATRKGGFFHSFYLISCPSSGSKSTPWNRGSPRSAVRTMQSWTKFSARAALSGRVLPCISPPHSTLANRSPVPGKDSSTQGFSVTVMLPVLASRHREPVFLPRR